MRDKDYLTQAIRIWVSIRWVGGWLALSGLAPWSPPGPVPTPTGLDNSPPAEPGHTPITVTAIKNLINTPHPHTTASTTPSTGRTGETDTEREPAGIPNEPASANHPNTHTRSSPNTMRLLSTGSWGNPQLASSAFGTRGQNVVLDARRHAVESGKQALPVDLLSRMPSHALPDHL